VISPGPCTPNEAGVSLEVIERLGATTPILGVCLGHQSIGQAYGGKVVRAGRIMHGKTSPIRTRPGRVRRLAGRLRGHALPLAGGGARLVAEMRWKSPPGPRTTMARSTRSWACATASIPVEGVQFHPESILTEHGHALLKNFLRAHEAGRTSNCAASQATSPKPCRSLRKKRCSAPSNTAKSSTTRWSS
jgi:anthranilate synthase component 2